jgi:endonuclease/exonuclease/phosphatase family metal-dependent hydrolase
MTANIESEEWGGTAVQPRAEILYANLTYYTPDVVGLQEVSIQWKDAIQSIFEGSEYTLLHEVVRGTDSNYCPIMYNTATVELIESDARRLSIGGPVKARTVTWGVFRHLESGKPFIVINTHLDWTKTPNDFVSQGATTPYSREQQVREIAEIFSTLKKKYSNAEIMLTADWNTMKNEHPLNVLTELTGVTYADDVATGHDWENAVDHTFIYPDAEIKNLYLYAHNAKNLGVSDHPWGFADLALRSLLNHKIKEI